MNIEDLIYVIYMSTLLGLMIALTITAVAASRRKKEPQPRTRTLLKCYSCGYSQERDYTPGDYVGKTVGECPQCRAPLVVHAIYDIYPTQERKTKITPKPTASH